ncbi:MAG: DUF2922 domain-containing protein [Defluviitaleaceae bacterium]|nr:DUF2922 domain-containing protein [Defluviitaleaceae bacterium]
MDNATHRFVLIFNTDIGRRLRISIPRACMDKDAANAQVSMEAIIANGAVLSASSGIPKTIKTAKTVTTQRRVIV